MLVDWQGENVDFQHEKAQKPTAVSSLPHSGAKVSEPADVDPEEALQLHNVGDLSGEVAPSDAAGGGDGETGAALVNELSKQQVLVKYLQVGPNRWSIWADLMPWRH